MALVQIIIMPMFFLSGALFPMANLPTWLRISTLVDPLTYAVDPMRRAVLAEIGVRGFPSMSLPVLAELGIVFGTGVLALAIAAHEFGKTE
jgi:ABC-2 type transport system permease protein